MRPPNGGSSCAKACPADVVLLLSQAQQPPTLSRVAGRQRHSDRCADGLAVGDYTVTKRTAMGAAVEVWWVAGASVGNAASHGLGPAPDSASG